MKKEIILIKNGITFNIKTNKTLIVAMSNK